MKPIIAVDLDGALIQSRPFDNAHKKWFEIMSVILDDESIKDYASQKDWFDKVDGVMKRHLGDVNEKTRNYFARNLYAQMIIADVTRKDIVSDFAEFLRTIKDRYRIALITTAPNPAVNPILEKEGCDDLFNYIYDSPLEKRPNKIELINEFIRKESKPDFYIGQGDKDISKIKELGIKTITVSWVKKDNHKGDYDIDSIPELKKIL